MNFKATRIDFCHVLISSFNCTFCSPLCLMSGGNLAGFMCASYESFSTSRWLQEKHIPFRSCVHNCAHQDSTSKEKVLMKIIISKMCHKHCETLRIGPMLHVWIMCVQCLSKTSWKVVLGLLLLCLHVAIPPFSLFFTMFYIQCMFQVAGLMLFNCAKHEIVGVFISDVLVESSCMKFTFCKADKTDWKTENS